MRKLRALVRGILLIFSLINTVFRLGVRPLFYGFNLPWALKIRRLWVLRTINLLGIKIEVQGIPPEGTFVFVGNHRSYIDPIVVLRDVKALPVAKAEVASWPLIGYGAKVSGVMYVKRESKRSRADTLDVMKEVLISGYSVLVYPEGTTHTLPHTMEFRQGAFKMASREGLKIVPMAIEYDDMGDAWVGDDTFIPHFIRCFGKKETRVKIAYGKPIEIINPAEGTMQTREWIDHKMLDMRKEFDYGKFNPTPSA